jgi:hypothetical protein
VSEGAAAAAVHACMESVDHKNIKHKQSCGQLDGCFEHRRTEQEECRRILRIARKGASVVEQHTHNLARIDVLVPLRLSLALNNLATTHGEVCSLRLMTAKAKG